MQTGPTATGDGVLQSTGLEEILRCPRCRERLIGDSAGIRCANPACPHAAAAFPVIGRQPVLIDFEDSLFRRESYRNGRGSVLGRDDGAPDLRTRFRSFVLGANKVADENARRLLSLLPAIPDRRARVLVIGGGAVGAGVQNLLSEPTVQVIATDVYASPNTVLVADGHGLPFVDACFDAVWVQAVLEHVLDPARVVAEAWRVLRPNGLIYAETPFMQQVHEAGYDFTRFTLSGHRWLFRAFRQTDAGVVAGPAVSLIWSIRYLARTLLRSDKAATLLGFPFFWLRWIDRFGGFRLRADAANGVFFLGSKTDAPPLRPSDMITYYEAQAAMLSRPSRSAR